MLETVMLRESGASSSHRPWASIEKQAWAGAAPFTLLAASLGLEFDQRKNEIRLRNPILPAFLEEVILREALEGDGAVT
jgi:hypothetical protein